ncbi:MAG: sensor histidine kinase [Deltaproteobacteria bacterium]|nr:MAG: sensor histidine kinase [Deltaproteobacteria bacterium]
MLPISGLVTMDESRFGIRFRLSIVLLLSALNSVLLAAVALVLFRAVVETAPPQVVAAVANVQAMVDVAHDAALTADLTSDAARSRIDQSLESAESALTRLTPRLSTVEADLATYRTMMERWEQAVNAHPDADPTSDPRLRQPLADLRLAYHHLTGSLRLATASPRPAWVESAVGLLPWAMGWVVLVGLGTVAAAWSLRSQLSLPLVSLSESARALARGDLSVPIHRPDSVPEIAVLADAMASARDALVQALRQQEARTARERAILQHMSDGVLLCDSDGKVLQLNPRAEQILWQLIPAGIEPKAGHPVHRMIKEITPELLAAGKDADLEVTRAPPGREHDRAARTWVDVTLRRVVGASPEQGSWVVVLRDVTAARALDAMQREFVSVVTHELKTPLTAIEGYARLLLRGKAGPLQPRQAEFVQTISDQSAVLKAMVQNLLDTSRIEDGTLPLHRQEVELAPIMEKLAATWEGSARAHDIELVSDYEGIDGVVLDTDPFRLEQLIGNLVGNALKFTPRGGRITLRARKVGDEAVLEVEDTGSGIPPDKLDRIFEKFYQVARGDTRSSGGTGLGLFICKQLVEALDGTISVRSTEGVGTSFTIRFPIVAVYDDAQTDGTPEKA